MKKFLIILGCLYFACRQKQSMDNSQKVKWPLVNTHKSRINMSVKIAMEQGKCRKWATDLSLKRLLRIQQQIISANYRLYKQKGVKYHAKHTNKQNKKPIKSVKASTTAPFYLATCLFIGFIACEMSTITGVGSIIDTVW